MKNFIFTLLLFYSYLALKRGSYINSYKVCFKIICSQNIKYSLKAKAFYFIAVMAENLPEDSFDIIFKKINKELETKDDLALINSLDFNASVSVFYYEKIARSRGGNTSVSVLNDWLDTADKYCFKIERMFPKSYKNGEVILKRLKTYLGFNYYSKIVKICDDYLKKNGVGFIEEYIRIILFFKAKSLYELEELDKAYKIYEDIKNEFSPKSLTENYILYHIHFDTGKYLESKKQFQESLQYYQESLSILNNLDKDYRDQKKPKLQKRIETVDKKVKG